MATPVLQDIWAKSAPAGRVGESLLAHTEAVIRALANISRRHPRLHTTAGAPRLWHWAFWGCCLHDMGKAATGFQQQLRTGSIWGHRHEVLSLAFLEWLEPNQEDRAWIAAAVASHHKDVDVLRERYPGDLEPNDLILNNLIAELPDEVLRTLLTELCCAGQRWRNDFDFASLGVELLTFKPLDLKAFRECAVTGICKNLKAFYRLARELAQGKRTAVELTASLLLRGLVITADHTASAHVNPPILTLTGVDDLLQRLGRTWDELYGHQRECAETASSVILTAPTGSGKTESALLWTASQARRAEGTPRIFYVLPFQASMNAMRQRLDTVFANKVGLQHGRSLHALYRVYLQSESTPQRAARQAKLAKNLSDLHAYPIKVLSPYQLLKACYRLRGYETLLTDCFAGLFIFDEMHAYEPERLAMIIGMMRMLRERLNAKFCVMTATMPPPIRARVQDASGRSIAIQATDELTRKFCRHRLALLDGELLSQQGLQRIVEASSSGHSVLACCNTVRRAQQLYATLKSRLGDIAVNLLHSRFTARDRLQKEGVWLEDQSRPVRPQGVLIATQVVEVSLNLDFDTIFTEPAPLEALFQRFGRVNRLGVRELATVNVFREPNDGQHVYDPLMVQRTLEVLGPADEKPVDESRIAIWLAEIYCGDILERWTKCFERSARDFEDVCLRTLHAFDADESLEDAFYQAFDSIDVLPASLTTEYDALNESEPILASELLVGISWRQYARLKNQGRAIPSDDRGRPPVVHAAYSFETGLSFDT